MTSEWLQIHTWSLGEKRSEEKLLFIRENLVVETEGKTTSLRQKKKNMERGVRGTLSFKEHVEEMGKGC